VHDSSDPAWWVFLSAALAFSIILVAFAAALVLSQRRFIALHRQYAEGLLETQEQERSWVAREVHDDALQRIALLVHELQGVHTSLDGERGEEAGRVDAVREEVEDLGVMLRRLAHRLHPTVIEQAGLVPALRDLATDVARASGVAIAVSELADMPYQLDPERSLHLFRIAQEAARNIVTHSGVRAASVTVRVHQGELTLTVEDDGRGFAPAESDHGRGLGIISMRERARLARGRLDLLAAPGRGTRVVVQVPLAARS
jgi:signal transduction histidine kinase